MAAPGKWLCVCHVLSPDTFREPSLFLKHAPHHQQPSLHCTCLFLLLSDQCSHGDDCLYSKFCPFMPVERKSRTSRNGKWKFYQNFQVSASTIHGSLVISLTTSYRALQSAKPEIQVHYPCTTSTLWGLAHKAHQDLCQGVWVFVLN